MRIRRARDEKRAAAFDDHCVERYGGAAPPELSEGAHVTDLFVLAVITLGIVVTVGLLALGSRAR